MLTNGKYSKPIQKFYTCSPQLYESAGAPVPVWNDTPYYVMKAPPGFIKNHDDIFQKGLYNFLMLMMSEDETVPVNLTPATISTNGNSASSPAP